MRPSTAAKTRTNNTTPKVSAADNNTPSRSDCARAISAMIAAGGMLESGNGKVSKTKREQQDDQSGQSRGSLHQQWPTWAHRSFNPREQRNCVMFEWKQIARRQRTLHQAAWKNRRLVAHHDLHGQDREQQPGRNRHHRDHRDDRHQQHDGAKRPVRQAGDQPFKRKTLKRCFVDDGAEHRGRMHLFAMDGRRSLIGTQHADLGRTPAHT